VHASTLIHQRTHAQDEQKSARKHAHDAEQDLDREVARLETTLAHLDSALRSQSLSGPAEVLASVFVLGLLGE
jgi:hypothetical protein